MTTEIKYHTKEDAIQAVNENGGNLRFCSPELKNNEEVVMTAIKEVSWAFRYASNELKSNKPFIMKALHEGVNPYGLVEYANISIQSDLEVMALAIEKDTVGWSFPFAQGDVVINKELSAKALVKWGKIHGKKDTRLWEKLNSTIKEFFPQDSFYEKAQAYLNQLEQEKQAELVVGGSTTEDEVVW